MSGIGVIIIILSLFPFMGQPSPKTVIDVVLKLRQGFANANWGTILLTSLTILIELALTLAVLGAIDSLLTSVIADNENAG